MTETRCEEVSPGLREEERLVTVRDAVSKVRSFLRVETDFLTYQDGCYYLPVGVVQEEPEQGLALVELSQDPDAGNRRLWIRMADFLQCPMPATRSCRTGKSASRSVPNQSRERQTASREPPGRKKANRVLHEEYGSSDMMEEIVCERVSPGLRREERTVCVRNAVTGLRSFLRIEADFLSFYRGKYYITVGVIQEEPQQDLLLVELPLEPDAGTTRLWVRASDTLSAVKASA